MAITYPLDMPATSYVATFEITQSDAVARDESPFTYQDTVHHWGGQRWSGVMTLPNMEDRDAADWEGWLASLKGSFGYFLAGDSSRPTPYGTANAATITGAVGAETVSVTMTGTLLRGDFFQLGTGADAKLHQVTQDQSGSGNLEIWPALRSAKTGASVTLTNPKGVFRLATNQRGWSIRGGGWRSISIPIVERV